MRILATGGCGDVGSYAVTQLVERGHEVAVFDIQGPSPIVEGVDEAVTFFRGNVTDPIDVYDTVVGFDPDRIVHMAAMLTPACEANPRAAFDVNVDGTIHVLEAASSVGVNRVVVASSISIYGGVSPDQVSTLEEDVVPQPDHVYAVTKFVVEHLCRVYREQRGLEFAALEPVRGLGPGTTSGYTKDAELIKRAVAAEAVSMTDEPPVETLHTADFASAFVETVLAGTLSYDRYIVGGVEMVTLSDIAELVRSELPDADITVTAGTVEDALALPRTGSSRLADDVGWSPEYSMAETIGEYVEWLQANRDRWSLDGETGDEVDG